LVLLLAGLFVVPVISQNAIGLSALELVRGATKNQLKNDQSAARFRYGERRITQKRSRTYSLVESDAGTVERLVAQNDRPLGEAERHSASAWLDRVLADPQIMRKAVQEDEQEAKRREKLIRVLPEAFLYEIEGEQPGGVVRIRFRPNPAFKPSSREAQICRGLRGTFWIDATKLVFVKAEGELVHEVNFGWGFLAHLDPGGHFYLEQTAVSPDVWRITKIQVNLTGREFIFKAINIQVDEQVWGFSQVADHLSLKDAVELLRNLTPDSRAK
jgi:hypothetical protein